MSGNGNRPVQGPKGEAKESTVGAADKGGQQKVCNDIVNILSGISHATPGNSNEHRLITEMKLHQILKHLMLKNNESARSAAKSCGVPLSTFNSYLKPKKQVDPAHVVSIAIYYGVTVDYLLTGRMPREDAFKNLPMKKLFSRWVKVTIEDLESSDGAEALEDDGVNK